MAQILQYEYRGYKVHQDSYAEKTGPKRPRSFGDSSVWWLKVSGQFWLHYQSFWFKVQNLLFIRHESDLWLNLSVTQAPTVVETWRKWLLQRKLYFRTCWFCFRCWCCCWGMRWRELSDSWHLGNSIFTVLRSIFWSIVGVTSYIVFGRYFDKSTPSFFAIF